MTSLSKHLTVSLTISLIFFFFIQAAVVGIEMRELAEESVLAHQQEDMEGILSALTLQEDQVFSLDEARVAQIYQRPFSGHYFQIKNGNQDLRSRSLWDSELPVLEPGVYHDLPGPENQVLIVFNQSYVLQGKNINISIAEDTTELLNTSRYLQKELLIFSFVAMLLLLAIQVWVIRRGLKPLFGVRQELQQLERGETDKLRHPVPAEIQPLVEEVNTLLLTLQQRLQRSRNTTGNLSHALKTPLTVIFQILERHKGDKDSEKLLEQAHSIQRHIDKELARARTAGQTPGGMWLKPEKDIRDLVETLAVMHGQRIDIAIDSLKVKNFSADREDMMELIGNLVDNACKWATDKVILSVHQDSELYIIVEDDGPGMSQEEQALVMGRGIRMDEAKPGHGLGLSIVQEVVQVYGGTLELGTSAKLGGLKVSVHF